MLSWFDEMERRKQINEDAKRKEREYESFTQSMVNSINRKRVAQGLRPRDKNGNYIYKSDK